MLGNNYGVVDVRSNSPDRICLVYNRVVEPRYG